MPSILDNDLYSFTQQQAVLEIYPEAQATYQFINRRPDDKLGSLVPILQEKIEKTFSSIALKDTEAAWLKKTCPFLKPAYIAFLKNYKFDISEIVTLEKTKTDDLKITIKGPWYSSILWEVPLMSLISECYFTQENIKDTWTHKGQESLIATKGNILQNHGCKFADFGTRRRRSYLTQEIVVQAFAFNCKNFLGTSNAHYAHLYGIKPIGTMAHQWIQAHSVLAGLRHANRHAFEAWNKVYNGSLGIALSDTYGSEAFFEDFTGILAHAFDGIRHDSGDPFAFVHKVVEHYKKLKIHPLSKTIVFSDSLTVEKARDLQVVCDAAKISCSFGIGTHFTNDFEGPHKALNMVIKMTELDGIPIVKLSDDPGKEIGDPDALRVAKWTFFGTKLDN